MKIITRKFSHSFGDKNVGCLTGMYNLNLYFSNNSIKIDLKVGCTQLNLMELLETDDILISITNPRAHQCDKCSEIIDKMLINLE